MANFPPPPISTIGTPRSGTGLICFANTPPDWPHIGFKVREVNGHIHSTCSPSSGARWTSPTLVASPYLSIHGMAPGLNYGVQTYEGQKAFRHRSGRITIFRPAANAARMAHSASFISVPAVPESHFLKCVNLAVAANAEYVPPFEAGAAMYIRPLLFGSSAQLGLSPPEEYTFVVFVMPTGVYHGVHAVDALILEDFDRAAPEGTGSAKIGGNYAPVLRHSEKARLAGYGITLHLDSKTRSEIDEFSTSGFIGVKEDGHGKVTLVVPDSKNVIKSVTSDSVCTIGTDMFGYAVERRRIAYEELKDFTEVMAAGTAASLVPIKSITMTGRGDKFEYRVGSKEDPDGPGVVCKTLLETLKGVQRGEVEDRWGWNVEVEQPPAGFVEGTGEVNGMTGGSQTPKVDQMA
jgi:branched-chain amino acid aminotransferase